MPYRFGPDTTLNKCLIEKQMKEFLINNVPVIFSNYTDI